MNTRKYTKKYTEASWPIKTYGSSTGWHPIHPNKRQSATNNQNNFLCKGLKLELRIGDVWIKGNTRRDTKTRPIARTPPSLFGILRKIAYTGKKYHSGTMCAGVDIGFAGI